MAEQSPTRLEASGSLTARPCASASDTAERFIDTTPDTYAWLPFGGGVRRCLGASFATLEMRVVLQTILENVELRPARARAEKIHRRAIVLAPRHGTRVRLDGRATNQRRTATAG